MKIEYPLYIDSDTLATEVPLEDETDFLIELFKVFASRHVIEAYKQVQQSYPRSFPPLLEEQ